MREGGGLPTPGDCGAQKEAGATAAFLASDAARALTGLALDADAGSRTPASSRAP